MCRRGAGLTSIFTCSQWCNTRNDSQCPRDDFELECHCEIRVGNSALSRRTVTNAALHQNNSHCQVRDARLEGLLYCNSYRLSSSSSISRQHFSRTPVSLNLWLCSTQTFKKLNSGLLSLSHLVSDALSNCASFLGKLPSKPWIGRPRGDIPHLYRVQTHCSVTYYP